MLEFQYLSHNQSCEVQKQAWSAVVLKKNYIITPNNWVNEKRQNNKSSSQPPAQE